MKPLLTVAIMLILSGCLSDLPAVKTEYMNPDGSISHSQSDAKKGAVLINPLSYIYEDHGHQITVTYVNQGKQHFAMLQREGRAPLKLPQVEAWAKGAKYQLGEITWQTQGDTALFIEKHQGHAFTKVREIDPITEWPTHK